MKKILLVALVSLRCGKSNGSAACTQPHDGSTLLHQSAIIGTDCDQMTRDMFRVTNSAGFTLEPNPAPGTNRQVIVSPLAGGSFCRLIHP